MSGRLKVLQLLLKQITVVKSSCAVIGCFKLIRAVEYLVRGVRILKGMLCFVQMLGKEL